MKICSNVNKYCFTYQEQTKHPFKDNRNHKTVF